jgi:hypothetical protein
MTEKTVINSHDKGLRLVVDETKNTIKLTREVPFSEVADLAILREAHRELGSR